MSTGAVLLEGPGKSGRETIRDYLQTETVWVNLQEGVPNLSVMR